MQILKPLLLSVFSLILVFSPVAAQPAETEIYETSYRNGDYNKSISEARRALKKNSADWNAQYFVGLSLLKQEKDKDAVKALEKAVQLGSTEVKVRAALAYAYMLRNDRRASIEANEALRLDEKSAEAKYVLGVLAIRDELYTTAYALAREVIAIAPEMAPAYLVKSQSLISSFTKQSDTILRPDNKRYELLSEAAGDIEKFLTLDPNAPDAPFYRTYIQSLRFFSDFYTKRPLDKVDSESPTESDPNKSPLRILHKEKAQYTNKARLAGISGRITLLVQFSPDGTIGHIMVVRSLGYGLDEQAIAATRNMRFVPQAENGVAVSTVRPVTYSFNIY